MVTITLKRPKKAGKRCWECRWAGGSRVVGRAEGPGKLSERQARAAMMRLSIELNSAGLEPAAVAPLSGPDAAVAVPAAAEVLTVGQVWARAEPLLGQHRGSTVDLYRRAMAALGRWVERERVVVLDGQAVRRFVVDLARSRKPNTVRSITRGCRAVYGHASIEPNPFSRCQTKGLAKAEARDLEPLEVEAVLRHLRSLSADALIGPCDLRAEWWVAWIELLIGSGLRSMEALSLRWDRVTGGADSVKVAPTSGSWFVVDGIELPLVEWSAKTASRVNGPEVVKVYRDVALTARTAAALVAWRDRPLRSASPYLFLSLERLAVIGRQIRSGRWGENQPMIGGLSAAWGKLQAAAQLRPPRGSLHDLRAGHCRTCQDAGLSVGETARRLGDDPRTILQHYDRRPVNEAQATRDKLENGACLGRTLGRNWGAESAEPTEIGVVA